MIIEVKGTQSAPAEDHAERYASRAEDAKSKTPLAFGMVVMGIALYLKSLFSGSEAPQAALPAPQPAKEGGHPDRATDAGFSAAATVPAETDEQARTDESPTETEALAQVSASGVSGAGFFPAAGRSWSPQDLSGFQSGAQPTNGVRHAGNEAGQDGLQQPVGSPATGGKPGREAGPQLPAETENAESKGPDNLPGAEDEDRGGKTPPGSDGDGVADGDDPKTPDETGGEDDGGEPILRNRAPLIAGPVQLPDVTACATVAIGLSDFLRGASDPDGDALLVRNLAVSSGALVASDVDWLFSPAPETSGPVTITYQVTDGELVVEQVAQLMIVRSAAIKGGGGDDLLLGTMCTDDIDGKDGDDNIDGRAGNDVVAGGAGDDHIVAGNGDDTVFAGAGNDMVFGGTGDDHLSGGTGDDRLFGEDGADIIRAGSGNDYLNGGNGSDILEGGNGDDTVLDGAGRDIVYSGTGSDYVAAASDRAGDVLEGGAGWDTLDYSSARKGLRIDLAAGTATGVEIGNDTISGFEKLVGGNGADHFIAGSRPVILAGGGGANVFEFTPPSGPSASPVMHEILDFRIGDRVRIAQYELFEKPAEETEDAFSKAYGESDATESPLRFRQDRTDELARTTVEADLDRDGIHETAIAIHGDHALVMIDTA